MAKLSKSSKKAAPKAGASAAGNKKTASRRKVVDLEEEEKDMETSEEESETEEPRQNGNTENKSSLLSECKKLFETDDLYKIFDLDKATASQNDIKKAYYKLSLKFHPDKVSGEEHVKKESTHKFQVLGKVYTILGDEEKRKIYDESGSIDDEDDEIIFNSDCKDWEAYWRLLFKKISKEDIDSFFQAYKDSAEERRDLLAIYEKHKGDMDLILDEVFSEDLLQDEERFRNIISAAIEKGEATRHDKFANENKKKANKRKANYQKEAKEAEEMRKELGVDESQESLRKAILGKRQVETDKFLDKLTEKYGGDGGSKKANGKGASKHGRNGAKKAVDELSNQENVSESEESEEEEEEYQPKKKPASRQPIGKAAASAKVAAGGKPPKKVKRL